MNFSLSKSWATTLMLLFIPFVFNAQITVNSSDLPQAGTTYTIHESTPDPLQDYTLTGAGVVWDYSDLESNSVSEITYGDIEDAPTLALLVFNQPWMQPDHVCDVFSPGELPDLSEMGVDLPIELSSFYNYYQTSGDNFTIAGISMGAQGIDFPVPYTDIDEIHPIPLNYGDEFNSTSAFTAEVPTMFSYSSEGERVGEVDGWGTLMLPNGTEHQVIRLTTTISKSDEITAEGMDEISFDYETTVYQWLGDGGMPYLEVQSTFGVPFRVRYQGETEEDTSSTEGINTVLQEEIKIYPNPAKSGESIQLQGMDVNSTWEVRDAKGNICHTGAGAILSTETLKTGAYFLIQRTSSNGLISRPAVFIVQ